jgi:2,4-dienoyl-CoA reductase-like NADH-dependent reductase (Old Yellow Enzyme family)
MTDELFKSRRILNKEAPNRFAAQAMEINSAGSDGGVNDTVINRYKKLAEGGWGIVFLEATSITGRHLARPNGLVLSDRNLDGFKRLVDEFRSVNDTSLFIAQLTHSGRQSGDFSRKVKVYEDAEKDAPVLTGEELDEVLHWFNKAVGLAKQAGFDGVDVKTCHGYFGAELLRPLNIRTDKYGGSVENRARLIASAIKYGVDEYPGFIVGTRMSVYEGMRGGCGTAGPGEILEDLNEMKQIVTIFARSGAHFLNISGGVPGHNSQLVRPNKNDIFCRLSHYRITRRFKEWFPDLAVIGSAYTMVDSSSLDFARENVSKGYTDFAGFGRQNLADELMPAKIRGGSNSVRYCTMCGRCSGLLSKSVEVYCGFHNAQNPYATGEG